jgi:hypothetical protein
MTLPLTNSEAGALYVATIGHNSHDPGPIIDLDAATKAAQEKAAEFQSRATELLAGFNRWKALGPIIDDTRQGKSGDFAVQLGKQVKLIEDARTDVKAPIIALGRAVDAAFKLHSDPLLAAKQDIESPLPRLRARTAITRCPASRVRGRFGL